jgi:hypothetical protein
MWAIRCAVLASLGYAQRRLFDLRLAATQPRYAHRWLWSLRRGATPLRDRQPWLVFAAIDCIESYLQRGMRVFEYGVGGSTPFFLDRGCQVVSVEHDLNWAAAAREVIGSRTDWTLHEQPPEPESTGDPSDPESYVSAYHPGSFRRYVETINGYDTFDVVCVDGRARPAALRHAIPKVRGLLVLDNSERDHYKRAMELARVLPRRDIAGLGPYVRFHWQTTIWQVPAVP